MEIKKLSKLVVLSFSFLCLSANADTAQVGDFIKSPGSIWGSVGNTTMDNKKEIVTSLRIEQGITVFSKDTVSLTPYVALAPTLHGNSDSRDKLVASAGLKMSKAFESGSVSVSAGYANSTNAKTSSESSAAFVQANTYFAWNIDNKYPGNLWGMAGKSDPENKNDVTATMRVEQGVIVHNFENGAKLVPFVEATYLREKKSNVWNTSKTFGAGLKVSNPMPACGCEVNLLYKNDHKQSGDNVKSVAVVLKFYSDWETLSK